MKKLLLHSCCGPCLSSVYITTTENFAVTPFWFNPNIENKKEYIKRFDSFKSLITQFAKYICHSESPGDEESNQRSFAYTQDDRKGSDDKTNGVNRYYIENENWQKEIKGLENEPEGGKRCQKCIKFRLEKTAKEAKNNNFNIFATTLSISPHKDAAMINKIGRKLAKKYQIEFYRADFKKNDGYKKSVELSKKISLYRQNYCGCRYSIGKIVNHEI